MPSKSKKQAKFMAAVANNPKFAKKAGVPQSVGQEFANADKRNKDMPSKFNSTANKPGKAVKKGYARGGMAHDKKVLRNLDDEVYRIAPKERMGGAEGRDARDERRRINREKDYEKRHMAKGGKVKKQGYNARLDESLGARNKTKGKQSLKSRRSESEGMEKASGKRKYSAVGTMDKRGAGKKKATAKKASNQATSPRTPQHKRMAMGENVVKKRRGGTLRTAADRRRGSPTPRPTPTVSTSTPPTPTPRPTPRPPSPSPTPGRYDSGGTVGRKGSAPRGWGIATKGWG